ncbi:alpha/beta hydrolase [Citricoccus nitrophenolicus]|uniref:Alpha/beta hydrolase n=1 Tax=Citricoccus nitrophenolicus TaxID=863575 RepID=A0ABV0IG69_9MICC
MSSPSPTPDPTPDHERVWSPPLPAAPGFEHLVVETPGLKTHLAVIGEGEPVVLLHGFPQHWWQWRQVAPVLAAAGYRVYCPDLRGAGWTEAADPVLDRESRLRDVLALLDALGIAKTHLVSHDMGVITAIQLTYAHPERFRSAVQLAVWPAFFQFSPKLAPAFTHLQSFILHRPGASLRGVFSPRYVARPLPEETIQAHLAPLSRTEVDAAVRPLTTRMVLPEAVRMLRGVYRRQRLTVPTLVVFGDRDHPTTPELMAEICPRPERYADRFEAAYVGNAAHFITDDAPAEVAELVLDWFRRTG